MEDKEFWRILLLEPSKEAIARTARLFKIMADHIKDLDKPIIHKNLVLENE